MKTAERALHSDAVNSARGVRFYLVEQRNPDLTTKRTKWDSRQGLSGGLEGDAGEPCQDWEYCL
ncbi:MAG: hypothetical protein OSB41_07615 [Kiritimatiellae bacterium]|nr:hypothetical protein [Kiritimatiellia bacterium]